MKKKGCFTEMKRLTALAVALILLCSVLLSSCAQNEEVPDGMKLASLDSEPFKLYVPEAMTLNLDSGISGAFSYIPEKFIISARYYTPDSADMSLESYMTYSAEGYADSLEAFNMTALEPAVLSGADALKMSYTAKIGSVDYSCVQFSALHKGDMVSLNFYIPDYAAEKYAATVKAITDEFLLCDKPEEVNDEVVDKKTPEGMKIASNDTVEYRLYVPKSWVCNSESGRSEAYYPESGRTNVTVTSYSPDQSMSAADYIARCEESYAKNIKGYGLISKEDTTVAERKAVAITYSANYDGVEYKLKQFSFVYGEMVYSIIYTATADNFELHTDDLAKIISEFTFR